VSVDTSGGDPDALSTGPAISGDGRHVAFVSSASDLVPGDGNGLSDVFVRDLNAGTTVRASVDNAIFGDPFVASVSPSISDDGRYVAFDSTASDSTGEFVFSDVFVRDLQIGTTTRVSVDVTGGMADDSSISSSISDSGRYVAFASAASDLVAGDRNDRSDVFVRDLRSSAIGTTTRVSVDFFGREANGSSGNPSISGDARYVAFNSRATDLVTGDGTTGFLGTDVFVRAVPIPTVNSVTPNAVARGTTATLTVIGAAFFPGAQVAISVFQTDGVAVNSVTVISETRLAVSVSVDTDAPTGERNLMVFDPGSGPGILATGFGFCFGCLTVT
jgi:Tol biopolymer transport system component